jgi:hypothetical protein
VADGADAEFVAQVLVRLAPGQVFLDFEHGVFFFRSAQRDRPQGEAGGGAADLVGHAHVAELVGPFPGHVFGIIKLATLP